MTRSAAVLRRLPAASILLVLIIAVVDTSASYPARFLSAATPFGRRPRSTADAVPRGGSTRSRPRPPRPGDGKVDNDGDGGDEDADDRREEAEEEYRKARAALSKYRSNQSVLLQLRSTLLSEALAARGVPVPTLRDVSTAEGDRPPEPTDWDCAMSTEDDPRTCLYSFDAEPNTKVVAPIGTDQWISLSALNRLRRTDPSKVEPMWHGKYAILRSWFSDESEFSLMQHVGMAGFLVSSVLLDLAGGMVLRTLLVVSVLAGLCVSMPALEYVLGRILVSSQLWGRWLSWHRIAHAALPFKLLVGQVAWRTVVGTFAKLEGRVRERAVDWECAILEDCVPLTVGPGVEEEEEGEDGGEASVGDDEDEVEEEFSESDDYEDESEW